jgi:hypothetical protein
LRINAALNQLTDITLQAYTAGCRAIGALHHCHERSKLFGVFCRHSTTGIGSGFRPVKACTIKRATGTALDAGIERYHGHGMCPRRHNGNGVGVWLRGRAIIMRRRKKARWLNEKIHHQIPHEMVATYYPDK